MTFATRLPLTFELATADLASGLTDGTYSRWGSMIRDNGTGQWRYILRESRPLQQLMEQNPASVPPLIAQQFEMLGLGLKHVMGLQFLTLGVTVAGFAYISSRLGAIDRKLDSALVQLQTMQHKLDWLNRRQDLALHASLLGALRTADWAERSGRIDQLVPVRLELCKAEEHYKLLLTDMMNHQSAYRSPEVYVAYAQQLALAGQGRIRCDWWMDGTPAGCQSAGEVDATFAPVVQSFIEPLSNYATQMAVLLPLGRMGFLPIEQGARALREIEGRVKGYHAELEVCRAMGARLDEWEQLGSEEKDARLLVMLIQA